jgi:ribonuclease HI
MSVDTLTKALQWKRASLKACIEALEKAELVYFNGISVVPKALHHVFAVSKIVAVEAKLGNWQRALSQAVGNTWFASESYILIPKARNNYTARLILLY